MRQLSWAVQLQLRVLSPQTQLQNRLPVNVQLRGHAGFPVDHDANGGEETTPKFSAAALLEVADRGCTALGVVYFVIRALKRCYS